MRSALSVAGALLLAVTPQARAHAQQEFLRVPARPSTSISLIVPSSSALGLTFDSSKTHERSLLPRRPTIEPGTGMSESKKGALIGAGVGLLAGLTGGILVAQNIHCQSTERFDAPPCHASRQRVGYVLLTSAGGAGIGALVGAGVGELVHAIRPVGAP